MSLLAVGVVAVPAEASALSAVVVTSVSSTSGSLTGGERLTVHGSGFVGVERVLFGGAVGGSVHVTSARSLTVVVPRHKAATLDIRVVTTTGTSARSRHDAFTYFAPPAVLSVTAGSVGGRITVRGNSFRHLHRVLFGSAQGIAVKVHSSTSLTVVVPAHAPGTVDVKVVTGYGTSKARTSDRFAFAAPISSIPIPIPTPTPPTPTPPAPVPPAQPPVVGAIALPHAVVGQPYAGPTLTVSAGTPPYRWSEQGLPNGIAVSAAGVVSGQSYAVSGTRRVVFTVTDADGRTASATASLPLQATSGQLYSWGRGDFGTLGNATTVAVNKSPIKITGTTGVVSVAGNNFDGFAVKSDGTVWGWGVNGMGEIGDSTTVTRLTPVRVPGLTGAVAVAEGAGTTYVLFGDGTVDAWGAGSAGELGNNETKASTVPAPIPGLSDIVAISTYGNTAFAVRGDGVLMGWGQNSGLIGDGSTANVLDAEEIPGLSDIIGVVPGVSDTFALHADGTVSGWGSEGDGVLNNGKLAGTVLTPIRIPGLTGITQLATGDGDYYALREDGTILAWGDNAVGELGDGNTNPLTTPTPVADITDAQAISASALEASAVLADGTVMAWGDNTFGQVGDGTVFDRTAPVPVTGLTQIVGVGVSPYGATSYAIENPLAPIIHPVITR
jgi:IPT/TIG domain/Regulator of chromosome condensation (RCC1) repeat